jgi:hypothetical protein
MVDLLHMMTIILGVRASKLPNRKMVIDISEDQAMTREGLGLFVI